MGGRIQGALLLAVVCAVGATPAASQSARVRVEIDGIGGELEHNVRGVMALGRAASSKDTLPPTRIRRLYGQAPVQIADAMEPFGFYRPTIDGTLAPGPRWVARFVIDSGPQLAVTSVAVRVHGPGLADSVIQEAVSAFPLAPGDPLLHTLYTAGKAAVAQAALNRGYLDAVFDTAQIRIDRRRYEAAIVLDLVTGPQYLFGPVALDQDVVDPDVLQGFITITQGEPFDARRLRTIQARLTATTYFSQVDVRPQRDAADGLEIPVAITLRPRKSQHYKVGVGYGTNTGPRVTFNAEFRRLNASGHYANIYVRASGVEKSMSARYSLPPRYPKTRLLGLFTGLALLDPVSYRTDKYIFGADLSRSRGSWRETLSLAYAYEDYVIGGADTGTSNLLTLSANLTHVRADNKIFATKGTQIGIVALGALDGLLSNASYFKVGIPVKVILPLPGKIRFIGRGEAGYIYTDQFFRLPPTVRYFTGGDRSVRGYDYLSLGPTDPAGNITGGDVLLVASGEVNYFFYKDFGAALFFDTGNALAGFDDISLAQGTGFGFRWRSPIGPIGIDLAWAISDTGDPRRIHITLGPDF